MGRILLVDGSNLLFQMYSGMPSRILNSEGKQIHGTLGFVGALLKMIRMVLPDYVAVFFDGEHENPRVRLDGEYKANRQEDERDSPFSQLEDVYRALDALKIRRAETVDCETDDWIAGYVKRFSGTHEIVIASMDSDFFQLVSPMVRVLRYRGKNSVFCDEAYIREKFGVAPGQYADLKVLVGDTADNIPGVPGVGVKTAARLMGEFGSLDGMLSRVQEIKRASTRTAIEENRERLRLNRKLIFLDGVHDVPFVPEEMAWKDAGATTVQVLHEVGLR